MFGTSVGVHIIHIYKVENCFNIHIVKTVMNKTVFMYSWNKYSYESLSGDVLVELD